MSPEIQKVIIDFDDTLFHTYRFKQAACSAARKFGFSEEDFWRTYQDTRDYAPGFSGYTFERHARVLHEMRPERASLAEIEASFNNIFQSDTFTFADAMPLLEYIRQSGKKVVLLSLGDADFQRRKVEHSGLASFFDRIETVDTHKLDILPRLAEFGEQIYFINDKANETREVLAKYPRLRALLKMRDDVREDEYEQSGLPYFHTLSALQTYLISHT